jgi:alpha-tubulin suppressor-like RCC1 family protein
MGPCNRVSWFGVTTALMLVAVGCREDSSPTGPALSSPALSESRHSADAAAAAGAPGLRHVSAGSHHTCGLTTGGIAYCWGDNFYGQLGDGTSEDRLIPVAVVGGLRFLALAAGDAHTCGIATDNRAYCWGYNYQGQLGLGSGSGPETCDVWPCSRKPLAVAGDRRFHRLAAGSLHTCAENKAGRAFCWGFNSAGQLGDGTQTERRAPVRVAGGFTFSAVVAGGPHTCALTPVNVAYCWGRNSEGQVGDGTKTVRLSPVKVAGNRSFSRISAGSMHTCGITTADAAYCWGFNYDGQLGTGTSGTNFPRRLKPTAVLGNLRFEALSAGGSHTCGIITGGAAYCWGDGFFGQLGSGSAVDRSSPVAVAGGLEFTEVGAGSLSSCGVATGDQAYCWGLNSNGELGNGSLDNSSTPVAVSGAT